MANIIEAEWEAKPKTGTMQIDLKEMGYTLKEFNALSTAGKESAINKYLSENEETILPKFVDFN